MAWVGQVCYGVSLGDIDGDGDLDAFVANGILPGQPNRVWLNNGSGSFTDSGNSLGNSTSYRVALGDVDGDGGMDAFVTSRFSRPNRVWLNDGSRVFTDSGNSLGGSNSRDVSLGDVDGDGDLDAFVTNYDSPNLVWLNAGSGTFTQSSNSLGGSDSRSVSLGDVDGDGDLDAFVANSVGEPNRVWLNDDDLDLDGVADSIDNCPDDHNPGQENLNGNSEGNVCDDDVDGDGALNIVEDPDDDNDGVLDVDETGGDADNPDAFNPDRDGDGIIDGLDPDPDTASNSATCENLDGPLATVSFTQQIGAATDVTCASTRINRDTLSKRRGAT